MVGIDAAAGGEDSDASIDADTDAEIRRALTDFLLSALQALRAEIAANNAKLDRMIAKPSARESLA